MIKSLFLICLVMWMTVCHAQVTPLTEDMLVQPFTTQATIAHAASTHTQIVFAFKRYMHEPSIDMATVTESSNRLCLPTDMADTSEPDFDDIIFPSHAHVLTKHRHHPPMFYAHSYADWVVFWLDKPPQAV